MPSESEFQSFFKYNRWMLAISTIMIFIILCIMIGIAVTVNSKVKEVQNIVNLLKAPIDKVTKYIDSLLPTAKSAILNTKDAVLNTKNTVVNDFNEIRNDIRNRDMNNLLLS